MAVDVMTAVLNHSDARGTDRLVLIALADAADPKNAVTWLPIEPPKTDRADSTKCITHRARCSKREALRAIQALEAAGEIQIRKAQRGQRRINVYRVCVGQYANTHIDYDDLPFTLTEPFSTGCQIVTLSPKARGDHPGTSRGDISSPHGVTAYARAGREPSREPSENLLPTTVGEEVGDRFAIELALSATLGVQLAGMTSRERDQWDLAIRDLLAVNATADQVTARCDAYRRIWPDARLTPLALVKHWSMLGAEIASAKPSGFEAWLEQTAPTFGRAGAHEVVEDMASLDAAERARRHELVDERFNALHTEDERSNAA